MSESDIRASFGFSAFQRHDVTRESVIEDSDSIHHIPRGVLKRVGRKSGFIPRGRSQEPESIII